MALNTDQQIYPLADKKPDQAHSNDDNLVLYYHQDCGSWISGTYSYIPEAATYWMMLPDSPAPTESEEVRLDKIFNAWLKEKYVDVVIRTAMYPTLKEVFLLGVKSNGRQ